MDWTSIPTHAPLTFTLFQSYGPAPPSTLNTTLCAESGTCDRCGECLNWKTIKTAIPDQCIGMDDSPYGHPLNECPMDEVGWFMMIFNDNDE